MAFLELNRSDPMETLFVYALASGWILAALVSIFIYALACYDHRLHEEKMARLNAEHERNDCRYWQRRAEMELADERECNDIAYDGYDPEHGIEF